MAEQPCGKRLKLLLHPWLPHYERDHGGLGTDLLSRVLSISAAQAVQLPVARKTLVGYRGRYGTRGGWDFSLRASWF